MTKRAEKSAGTKSAGPLFAEDLGSLIAGQYTPLEVIHKLPRNPQRQNLTVRRGFAAVAPEICRTDATPGVRPADARHLTASLDHSLV
jgi:hypothetical protein